MILTEEKIQALEAKFIAIKYLQPGERYLIGEYYWTPTAWDIRKQVKCARNVNENGLTIIYHKVEEDPKNDLGIKLKLKSYTFSPQELEIL